MSVRVFNKEYDQKMKEIFSHKTYVKKAKKIQTELKNKTAEFENIGKDIPTELNSKLF